VGERLGVRETFETGGGRTDFSFQIRKSFSQWASEVAALREFCHLQRLAAIVVAQVLRHLEAQLVLVQEFGEECGIPVLGADNLRLQHL
jgi:hypothetical protein